MASYQLLPLTTGEDQGGPHNPHSRPMSKPARYLASVLSCTRTKRRAVLIGLILSTGVILLFSLGQSMDLALGRGNSGNNANISPEAPWTAKTYAQDFELPEATWTCTDDDLSESEQKSKPNKRSRQCIVENFCVDRKGKQRKGYLLCLTLIAHDGMQTWIRASLSSFSSSLLNWIQAGSFERTEYSGKTYQRSTSCLRMKSQIRFGNRGWSVLLGLEARPSRLTM